jgi:hypothetical protein
LLIDIDEKRLQWFGNIKMGRPTTERNWNQNMKETEPWGNPEQHGSGRVCKTSRKENTAGKKLKRN